MAEYLERETAVMRLMQDGCSAKNVQTIMALPAVDIDKISDGFHTFADLYEQRLILSAALAKNNPHAWKSKRHEDGSVPFGGGWFIMGFDTDEGSYTYHYELKDWGLFQCKELDKGKPWDGHTSRDVRRLLSIPAADGEPVARCPECKYHHDCGTHFCDRLGMDCPDDSEFFCKYGARMDGAK